jgi:transmembrane sensor
VAVPVPNPSPQIEPAVIRQAARWLVRLHSGEAGPDDHAAFQRWREARAEHELAWQRAERLSRQFGAVPPMLGVPVLTRHIGLSRRDAVRAAAVLGMVFPLAWISYRYAPWLGGTTDYHTAIGQNSEVRLADGSRLTLNTGTAVDLRFSEDARLLQLRRGEIYVQTAPDAENLARPFLIETAQGRLRALGTRFVVRQLDGGDQPGTCLRVLEHRVEITLRSGGLRRIVNEGEEVRFTSRGFEGGLPAAASQAAQASDPPGWTRGALNADNMRLDAFLAELSRYRPGVIRCDPEVAGLRVSGGFQLGDTDHILAVVRETLPVRIVRRTPYWVTVTAKAG